MWLIGYWMERGYSPEMILGLSADERAVWQAVAELNEEKRNQDMTDCMMNALTKIVEAISKGR